MTLHTHNPADNTQIGVGAVCGNEVRLYGPVDNNTGKRPYRGLRVFANMGQALDFANEYEETERGKRIRNAAVKAAWRHNRPIDNAGPVPTPTNTTK